MKVLSLFSGIGAFEKALKRLNIDYELVNYCEIDKYASKSYSVIHNISESLNLGDITQVDTSIFPKDIDLITYGFPCQDISLSGKLKGFEHDGKRTRSGLFFEALRIIEDTKPRFAICENVKNLTSKKFSKEFEIVLKSLESAGYRNYWKVLNSKDYGIPQNRERVFIVSIRSDLPIKYNFPCTINLRSKLLDFCDKQVDDKYFLSDKSVSYVCSTGTKNFHYTPEIDLDIARPLTATMSKMHRASVDNYLSENYLSNGTKAQIIKGYPVIVYEATKKGYTEAYKGDSINFEQPNSKTRRGRVGHQISQTITTSPQIGLVISPTKIRKLTPLECWRLMGFDDADFKKAEQVNSNSQLYKQAGNSIVVNVLEHILKELFKEEV